MMGANVRAWLPGLRDGIAVQLPQPHICPCGGTVVYGRPDTGWQCTHCWQAASSAAELIADASHAESHPPLVPPDMQIKLDLD